MITVIDSCTWIDATIHGGVEESAIHKAFDTSLIAGCDQLWKEIEWVLTRKFHLLADIVRDDLAFFRMHSLDVQITGGVKGCIDPDDDFLLECAVRSGARVIVSNDLKHLVRLGSFEGIPIVTPSAYLADTVAENRR